MLQMKGKVIRQIIRDDGNYGERKRRKGVMFHGWIYYGTGCGNHEQSVYSV